MFNNRAFNPGAGPTRATTAEADGVGSSRGRTHCPALPGFAICEGGKWSFKLITSARTKVSCPLKVTGFSSLKTGHHFKRKFFWTDAALPALRTFYCPLPAERRPPPAPFPELSKLPLRVSHTFIHIPNYWLFVISLQRHVFPQLGGKRALEGEDEKRLKICLWSFVKLHI